MGEKQTSQGMKEYRLLDTRFIQVIKITCVLCLNETWRTISYRRVEAYYNL